jgi:hypothetical protein
MQRRPRQHDKKHLAFVADRPCVICRAVGNGIHAHHIKMADARVLKPQSSNIGMKADDRYTLPLCSYCHNELHAMGERKFWGTFHVDASLLALCLYSLSVRGDEQEADRLIETASYALQALRG